MDWIKEIWDRIKEIWDHQPHRQKLKKQTKQTALIFKLYKQLVCFLTVDIICTILSYLVWYCTALYRMGIRLAGTINS